MKLLIVHNQISPYRLPIFEELNKRFKVKVLFCEPRAPDRLWETKIVKNFNFKWRVLPGKRLRRLIINNPLSLTKEIKSSDIVIVAENVENMSSTLFSLIIAKLFRKKFILWTERIESPWIKKRFRGLKGKLKRAYEKFIMLTSDEIAAYSRKSREYVMNLGVSPGKIFEGVQVMPEDVYPKEIEKAPIPSRRAVLYLGYMRPEKGVLYLIRAFKKLKTDAILILAGTGPLMEKIKEEAPKNAVITGYVPENAKPYLYRHAYVFILPTLHDPWGLVVNEAFYYGTPVITTTAAAASEIIDEGKTGFVVEPQNKEVLAKTLRDVLWNPKLVRKMKHITSKKGRRYSETELGSRHLLKAIERLK
ncbi:glycosyltransferase family 4 protein [Thermococcus sp.]